MVALDISFRPLGSILTCRHLESQLVPNTNFRWYGAERLNEMNALRQEASTLSGPYVQRLWELRSAQRHDPETARLVGGEIEATVDQFMSQMRQVLGTRRGVLDQLHLPLEACMRLVRIAIERFVEKGLSEADWEVPDELLELFPEDVRSYFRPRAAAQMVGTPPNQA